VHDITLTAGNHLQLRFFRRADRWQHVVEFRQSAELLWQLSSDALAADAAEPAFDENWPSSPPFQNLELHTEPGGRMFALLVGMAGASHWSASVEADPQRERFVFDVACRVKTEPAWLGSSYIVEEPLTGAPMPLVEIIDADPTAAVITSDPTTGRITVRVANLPGPLPRTFRWKYAISVTV
jgi:hypothetical protein